MEGQCQFLNDLRLTILYKNFVYVSKTVAETEFKN